MNAHEVILLLVVSILACGGGTVFILASQVIIGVPIFAIGIIGCTALILKYMVQLPKAFKVHW